MIKISIGKWFSLRIGRLPARKAPARPAGYDWHSVVPVDRPKLVDDYLQDILTRETQ